MSILTSMWSFSSPAPKSTPRDTRAENPTSQSQTPANHGTPCPQQSPLTAHLQPGTPEARRAATELRRRAQSMMVRAQEIQYQRSNKIAGVSTRLRTRVSSTSGVQRPARGRTVSVGARTLSSGTPTRSGGVRTRTAPTPSITRPSQRSSGAGTTRSCRPATPSPSPSSIPHPASPTVETLLSPPPSPTGITVLHSSLLVLENLVKSFGREFFTGRTTVSPSSEKDKEKVLCASLFWAKSPETRAFVRSHSGADVDNDDDENEEAGWQYLWTDEDKRKDMVEKVIWNTLMRWGYAPWVSGGEKQAEDEEQAEFILDNNQSIVMALVAQLTPFLALMHGNPYHELDTVLLPLLEISVAATMLCQRMWMRKDIMDRYQPFFEHFRSMRETQ